MNRTTKLAQVYESYVDENGEKGNFNGGRIVKDDENFSYYIDLDICNAKYNETDNKEMSCNDKNPERVERAITLTYNDIDYKDIITTVWEADKCITKEAANIIFDTLGLLPKVITGHYLRFVNVYQYNNYLVGKKGYDKIPSKYMTLQMAKNIKINNGLTPIPNDLEEAINEEKYNFYV